MHQITVKPRLLEHQRDSNQAVGLESGFFIEMETHRSGSDWDRTEVVLTTRVIGGLVIEAVANRCSTMCQNFFMLNFTCVGLDAKKKIREQVASNPFENCSLMKSKYKFTDWK